MVTTHINDDVLDAVDALIEAFEVEPDERPAVAEAGRHFTQAMMQWAIETDRQDWQPLAVMAALEMEMLRQRD
jgi:hypothetical protein